MLEPVLLLGDDWVTGTYILRIVVSQPLAVVFGRFRGGEALPVPAGVCLYIGSAMGRRGAATLARRLARHASRCGDLAPHPVYPALLSTFSNKKMLLSGRPKRCHWHVDYLLDRPEAALTHVIALRSEKRLEPLVAERLNADPQTAPLAPGLGASDARGSTHLLQGPSMMAWWAALPVRLRPLLNSL